MTRRLFYVALGAAVGVLVVRRVTATAQRYTPAGIQTRAGGALGGFGQAVGDFSRQVRVGMSEREQELRTELGLDGSHDVVDTPRDS